MDIQDILRGNLEFNGKADKKHLSDLAENGQKPVATVVACSDSREPVEVIFNMLEPGELFVIRVAGNLVGDVAVKGSIEYAVRHLRTPYLIIMGHTGCGAVQACLEGNHHEGEVGELLALMELKSRDMSHAVTENITVQVEKALSLEVVKEAVAGGKLTVYGMLYDLVTGRVSVLSQNGKPALPERIQSL